MSKPMTEAEWLTSEDPARLLDYLALQPGDRRPGARQLRLFACACYREAWPLLTDPRSRQAVEVAERFADGQATKVELAAAWAYAGDVAGVAALGAARAVVGASVGAATTAVARKIQVALLRDIVGNLWRPVASMDYSLCEKCGNVFLPDSKCNPPYLTPVARDVAETIYQERRWDELPILADALEEAGCVDVEILQHLRGKEPCFGHDGERCTRGVIALGDGSYVCPTCNRTGWTALRGPHCRGCWALDCILGRSLIT